MPSARLSRRVLVVLAILLVAGLFRAWLIAADGVAFESDEAVVGLMARHITQGKTIPVFYYGQDYMGSLDAILVVGGFALAGDSVEVMRAVQAVLYLLALVTAYALARVVTGSDRVAAMALLLLAIPTTLGALYTTIALGGYNEIVLLGNLVLLLGWQVTAGGRREGWRWGLLGLCAGIGWWVNGAIITACAVVVILGWRVRAYRHWRGVALAGAAFLVGSAPWWWYNLRHDWAALAFLTGGFEPGPGVEPISPAEALIGLLVLGLPALYGLRGPWEAGFTVTAGVILAGLVYLLLVTDLLAGGYARLRGKTHHRAQRGCDRRARQEMKSAGWVWLVFGVFTVVFALSSFSDATGRYLMPVWVPAAIGVALGLERLRRAGWAIPAVALGLLLAFQAGSVFRATTEPTGLTPQLVERLRTPAEYDAPLLDFLAEAGYAHGYAGYWASYRLAFRSGEAVIFDTALPYHEQGYNPENNRYPPYVAAVAAASRTSWITQNFPELDALIAARLAARGITYRVRDFGPYRVYFDFSARVDPRELGLDSQRPIEALLAADDGTDLSR